MRTMEKAQKPPKSTVFVKFYQKARKTLCIIVVDSMLTRERGVWYKINVLKSTLTIKHTTMPAENSHMHRISLGCANAQRTDKREEEPGNTEDHGSRRLQKAARNENKKQQYYEQI